MVRFSLHRFIFHNKTVIILTVLILSIILLLSQKSNNLRSRIASNFKTDQEQPTNSKIDLDQYYKDKLVIRSNETNGPCENAWMVAAIPGNDFQDYLWEYLSLLSINQVYGQSMKPKMNTFLSYRTIKQLEHIFERIDFPDLGTVANRCYQLSKAILLENDTDIHQRSQVNGMFLLREGKRRYRDITKSDQKEIQKKCKLNDHFKAMASMELLNFKAQLEIPAEKNVPIVGMYIQTLELPPSYYERAMKFLRKIHFGAIFMVICRSHLILLCRETFSDNDTSIIEQRNEELELAMISICNHTIVENEFGILGALINENGGDTVVYNTPIDEEMGWFTNEMTSNYDNWYAVA